MSQQIKYSSSVSGAVDIHTCLDFLFKQFSVCILYTFSTATQTSFSGLPFQLLSKGCLIFLTKFLQCRDMQVSRAASSSLLPLPLFSSNWWMWILFRRMWDGKEWSICFSHWNTRLRVRLSVLHLFLTLVPIKYLYSVSEQAFILVLYWFKKVRNYYILFHTLSDQVFLYAFCDQKEKSFNECSHALLLSATREKRKGGEVLNPCKFPICSFITFCIKNSECYRTFLNITHHNAICGYHSLSR